MQEREQHIERNTMTNTGKEFERLVAQSYRRLGARKVEHDVDLAGHQVDVYVELEVPDRSLHRLAIDAKDHTSPVGVGIVSGFSDIVDRLRRKDLIDEGVIVSATGFTRPGRIAAETHSLRLLEWDDLDVMVTERLQSVLVASQKMRLSGVTQDSIAANLTELLAQFRDLQEDLGAALASDDLGQALVVGSRYSAVADSIADRSMPSIQAGLPRSSDLSINLVCDLQRTLFPEGYALVGLRRTQVWIGSPGTTLEEASFVPPQAGEVIPLLEKLFSWWNISFDQLASRSSQEKLEAIAEFHSRFWSIHPFLDGNGDVSRLILSMQLRDLLNIRMNLAFSKEAYYDALLAAALGDRDPLFNIVLSLVE